MFIGHFSISSKPFKFSVAGQIVWGSLGYFCWLLHFYAVASPLGTTPVELTNYPCRTVSEQVKVLNLQFCKRGHLLKKICIHHKNERSFCLSANTN
jgi:hypothetical protein